MARFISWTKFNDLLNSQIKLTIHICQKGPSHIPATYAQAAETEDFNRRTGDRERRKEALWRDYNKKLCCCRGTARRVLSLVTTKLTFKLTQGHWYNCQSIGYTRFLLVFHCNSNYLFFCIVFEILSLIPKISRGHVTSTTPCNGR